jgi:hypothetical protein
MSPGGSVQDRVDLPVAAGVHVSVAFSHPGWCTDPLSTRKGDLNDYWEHHITHDQQRLYRKDSWQLVLK